MVVGTAPPLSCVRGQGAILSAVVESERMLQVRRRMETRRRRVIDQRKHVTCPHGEAVGQPQGCHCRLADDLILASTQPSPLDRYCTGDDSHRLFFDEPEGYRQCPTFVAMKQHEEEQRQAARRREFLQV